MIRLWREPPEAYLTAGIGLVPLAPLTDVTEPDLRGVISRMADRINREPRPRAAKLWTATSLLMGLRFSDDVTYSVLEGVQNMRESTTYQRILREGRTEGLTEGQVKGRVLEAQRVLLLIGRERFSEPDSAKLQIIEEIHDVYQLETLIKRVLHPDVHDWNDLLGFA